MSKTSTTQKDLKLDIPIKEDRHYKPKGDTLITCNLLISNWRLLSRLSATLRLPLFHLCRIFQVLELFSSLHCSCNYRGFSIAYCLSLVLEPLQWSINLSLKNKAYSFMLHYDSTLLMGDNMTLWPYCNNFSKFYIVSFHSHPFIFSLFL